MSAQMTIPTADDLKNRTRSACFSSLLSSSFLGCLSINRHTMDAIKHKTDTPNTIQPTNESKVEIPNYVNVKMIALLIK